MFRNHTNSFLIVFILLSIYGCKSDSKGNSSASNQLVVNNDPNAIKDFDDMKKESQSAFNSNFKEGSLPLTLLGADFDKEFNKFKSISPKDFKLTMGPTELVPNEKPDSYKSVVSLPPYKNYEVRIYGKRSDQGSFGYAATFDHQNKLIGILAVTGKVNNGSNVVVDCKVDDKHRFFVRSIIGKMYNTDRYVINDEGLFVKDNKPNEILEF